MSPGVMSAVGHMPSREWLARSLPLLRMLLLSASLHAAMVMIVQPRPYRPAPEVVVISARLSGDRAEQAAPVSEPASPGIEESPPAEAVPASPAVLENPPVDIPVIRPANDLAEATVPATPAPEVDPATAASPAAPTPAAPSFAEWQDGAALPSVPVMVDSHWYEARQLDVQPSTVATIQPRYPPRAIRNGIEGSVKLKLRVDEFGVVREAEVEEGDPPGVFDESALEAFSKARFQPARRDGRPVRALIYIRVRYELGE